MITFIGNRIFVLGHEWTDFTPLHRRLLEALMQVKPGTQISKENVLLSVYEEEYNATWGDIDSQRLEQLVSRTNKKLSALVFGNTRAHRFIQTPAKYHYALVMPEGYTYDIQGDDLSHDERTLLHLFRSLGPNEQRLLIRTADAWGDC